MASAQCQKPSTDIEVCQPKNQHSSFGQKISEMFQKPSTTNEVCQPKSQHNSFGQKISEITSKAFKGNNAGHGNNQNQLQCSSHQVESHGHNGSKTESHYYGQTQTQHDKKHGVSKTQITVCVVQAEITETYEDPYPYGTTTTCFGTHAKKNGEFNNKKDRNLFRRIKNGMSRHNNDGSSSSSDSESDDEKKCPKTKASGEKCPKTKASGEKCPKTKAGDEKCPKTKN